MTKFIFTVALAAVFSSSAFASIECTGIDSNRKSKRKEVLFTYYKNALYMKDGGTEFFIVPYAGKETSGDLTYQNEKYLITLNLTDKTARVQTNYNDFAARTDKSYTGVVCEGNGYE